MPTGLGQRPSAKDRGLIPAPEPPRGGIAPGDDIDHIAVTIFNGKRERE
ncbi:MAG: hypothetical protein IID55_13845 [Proteobacteria bacterium]|nr:hypothetical protein [Pseudomonadota bacterium]